MGILADTPLERIDRKLGVDRDPEACWVWPGVPATHGYMRITFQGHGYQSHRFTYEALIGPIPDGLDLDHLCRNRSCCNPWHCTPKTHRRNVLDGDTRASANAVKTECSNGHAFTPENTYVRTDKYGRTHRTCRACNNAATLAYYHRKKH